MSVTLLVGEASWVSAYVQMYICISANVICISYLLHIKFIYNICIAIV